MTLVVNEMSRSISSWHEDQRRRLVLFIRLDALLTVFAAGFVVVVYAFYAREPYLLTCGLVVALAGAVMVRAAAYAQRGSISRAIGWLAAGNWLALAVGAVLAPAVWPVYPLAALLPAIAAAPYVRQDEFRRYLIASVAAATLATFAGLFSEFTSIEEDVSTGITDTLQAVFVPLMTATLGFLALQNFARIRSMVITLTDAHEAMRFQANDLLASRSRMLAATDRERRRIERDLHDGTQQHFVAMAMRLSAIRALLPEGAREAREQIDRLRGEVHDAQRDLRNLTAAIYPATLSQHGLTSAIRFIADRFASNATTDIDEVGRCDPNVEAAVYFTCMEAVQNASKHAGEGAALRIELHRAERELVFVVADDGVGFDPGQTIEAGGTTNMHDRMGAVLGSLVIESAPGRGTTVTGTVRVAPRIG